jgi:predicted RNA-binding protein with PIN domain
MTSDDQVNGVVNDPIRAADVEGLPSAALRDALEFAVGIAAAGQKLRPPLIFPAGLKPYLKFQRLDNTSLPPVRRAVVADEAFRDRLAMVATVDLIDEVGVVWLQRGDNWEKRVLELHAAAQQQADETAGEVALRKSQRRREAAEQVAARAQAELLARRDDIAREQTRREKAEAKAASVTAEKEVLRRELAQLQRELDKLRRRAAADAERADLAGVAASEALSQVRVLEALRDEILARRAAEVVQSLVVETPSATGNAQAAQALHQAASATRELAEALSLAAGALTVVAAEVPTQVKASRQRPSQRRPIAIPGGVYGDTVAAAVHLLRTPQVCVIVDGYNVAKLAWPKLELVKQRECCIELLEDLGRRFGTDIRVIFDGADVIGASAGRRLIRVQYSPAGVIADDVIRAEVAALPAKTHIVVVTNDQAIASDVRACGVNVLASDTLLAAAGRPVKPA